MKIDVLDKAMFHVYHDELKTILKDIRKEIDLLKKFMYMLQDRIKMLEDKDEIRNRR